MIDTVTETRPEATGNVTADAPETPARVYTDVWSWTARKYRIRATVLLTVNVLLFCGLCVFTHWLHVGKPFQFELSTYLDPARFWGPQTQNLYDFILYPIAVDQMPIYGVVIGLLFAAIVAVPISVSILYRFRSSLPFCAAVLVFAHLPWLAVTLAGSCILASVRPFRMQFRYGSALVAMLPVLLYLYLATRGSADALSASVSPERKVLLNGPWLLAILAACTMLAAIIFIARIVHYRPGAVAPVMAVMFATPAVLFHVYVGVDELHYRVLELGYGPRAKRFEPIQDATGKILDFVHAQTQRGTDRAAQHAFVRALWSDRRAEQVTDLKRRISAHLLLDLMRDRQMAYEACEDFIADHPGSRYVPNVLFIQARALDMRLDELKFAGENAQRELYTDFPHVQSEPVWTSLLMQYPDSPLAVAAQLRVAQLRLRRGDVAGALGALDARPRRSPAVDAPRTQPAQGAFLRSAPPESSLGFDAEPYLFEIRRLRELVIANAPRDERLETAIEPLKALASLDPHRRLYHSQLRRLAHDYADTILADNLVVRWAQAHADREERAAKLAAYIACAAQYPDNDALPEAMFHLAELEVQSAGGSNDDRQQRGINRLREIVEQFSQTCWGDLAAERLRMLAPQAATSPSSES
jgi:outer membrane protein assembly factor BamD (BamD/ComL family)